MPSPIQHTLVSAGDQQFLTTVLNGKLMPPIDDSHPNFEEILEVIEDPEQFFGDPITEDDLAWLEAKFDVAADVAARFEKLSERVTASGGKLFFDGDAIDGTIVETILRFLDAGEDDFKPLVNYIEKIASNPEPHSREQLYDWLRLHDTISITPEGDLIAYKGVSFGGVHPETGEACYRSGFTGQATVDGVTITGHIPNYVGAEVTMPRSQVAHDPSTACHTGLHVGTFDYAKGYAHGAMLAVRVNPRDVVSVPTDGGGAKIRVCRYVVEEIIDRPKEDVLVDEYLQDSDGAADAVKASFNVGDYVRATGNSSATYNYTGVISEVNERGVYSIVRQVDAPERSAAPYADTGQEWFSSAEGLEHADDPHCAAKVGDFVRYAPNASDTWTGRITEFFVREAQRYARVERSDSHPLAGTPWWAPVSSLELWPESDAINIGDRLVDSEGDTGVVRRAADVPFALPRPDMTEDSLVLDYDAEEYGHRKIQGSTLSAHNDVHRAVDLRRI